MRPNDLNSEEPKMLLVDGESDAHALSGGMVSRKINARKISFFRDIFCKICNLEVTFWTLLEGLYNGLPAIPFK